MSKGAINELKGKMRYIDRPLWYFIRENKHLPCGCDPFVICDPQWVQRIPLNVFYDAYKDFCSKHELLTCTKDDFMLDLQNAGFTLSCRGNVYYGMYWTVHVVKALNGVVPEKSHQGQPK